MIAGIPELVCDGVNGWLIPAGNVDELVIAMRNALETPAEELNAMGLAGRERVRERHFTRTEVDKLERLFQEFVPLSNSRIAHANAVASRSAASMLEERA